MNKQEPGVPLRRVLGLFEVNVSDVRIVLGAGIYVLIGQAAGLCGNAVWLAFFGAAVICAKVTRASSPFAISNPSAWDPISPAGNEPSTGSSGST